MTVWEAHIADYLRPRHHLGCTLGWDEHVLGQFTTHLNGVGDRRPTAAVMIDWAGLPHPDGGREPHGRRSG